MTILRLTGDWYLKKKFFGGYKVIIQVEACYECPHDFSFGPIFKTYVEGTAEQLIELGIKIG